MTEALAERDAVLAAVHELIGAAAGGRGGALFVTGEAGLGKTTVLEHAVALAGGRFRTGVGKADVAEAALPFGLIGQALEQVFGEPVEPERSRPGEAELPAGGYLYAVLSRLRAPAAGPLLIALDDAHWADSDSLILLRLICRRIAALPVAVLVTARPWPPDALRAGEELAGQGVARVCGLTPLSAGSAAAVLRARAGAAVPATGAEQLAALCGGNPLLLERMAAVLQAGHTLPAGEVPAGSGWARRLLLSHMAGLGEPAERFLRAAAVVGRRFQPEVAAEVAGLSMAEAAAAQEAVAAAGLARDAGVGWAEFSHELVRQAVYELAAPMRARLHEAAFRVLAARQANPAEAAAHAIAARLAGDPAAVEVLTRAGRDALRAGAIGAARRHLQAAADLAGRDASADLLCDLGRALMAGGSHAAAAALYEDLLGRGPMPAGSRFEVLSRLSLVRAQERRFDEADACMEEALRLAAPDQPDLAAAAMVNHAVLTMLNRGVTMGLPRAVRARELAAGASAPVRAAADSIWACCAYLSGDPAGLEVTRAAASTAAGAGSWDPAGSPWWDPVVAYAIIAISAERLSDAERELRNVLASAERRSEPMMIGWALFYLVGCMWRAGRLAEAADLCGRLAEVAEVVPVTFPLAAAGTAMVLLERGRLDEAASWCARLDEAARQDTGFHMAVDFGYYSPGVLAFRRGDPGAACAIFSKLEDRARGYGVADPCFIPWAGDAIAAYLACGQEDDARRVIASLEAWAEKFPARWPASVAAAGHAALAERRAGHEAARDYFSQALDLADQARLPLHKAHTLTSYGAFLTRHGDSRTARPLLAEAVRIADGCGAAWHAERARAEWRRAGGRSGTTPPGELTPQEAAVARLAKAGQTNKQIAAQLYLSVNTVETHLAHVYQKLGINRRSQLPAFPGADQQSGPR
ncbi:MAG: AAA family ATPase [Actinobacteria bacterium]|nr:AAA family ATPase [Actinomycetota bacterium]